MGGVSTTSDPVAKLIEQVNRFGPGAPKGYQYVTAPYGLATGTIPTAVAVSAAFILYRRAQDAALRYGDSESLALLTKAASAQASPVAYVTANIAAVTAELQAFADSVGAPAAGGFSSMRILGVPVSTLAIAAGGLGAIVYLLRKKRRS